MEVFQFEFGCPIHHSSATSQGSRVNIKLWIWEGRAASHVVQVEEGDCLLEGTLAPLPNLLSGRLIFYIPTFPPSANKRVRIYFDCFFLFFFVRQFVGSLFTKFSTFHIYLLTHLTTCRLFSTSRCSLLSLQEIRSLSQLATSTTRRGILTRFIGVHFRTTW